MAKSKKKKETTVLEKKESTASAKDQELLELAKKELLRDVKCASIRAEQYGAHSWAKPQKYNPSKQFLQHMILNNSSHNRRKQYKYEERKSYREISPENKKREKRLKKDKGYSPKHKKQIKK